LLKGFLIKNKKAPKCFFVLGVNEKVLDCSLWGSEQKGLVGLVGVPYYIYYITIQF
jgi:hypothetical protein